MVDYSANVDPWSTASGWSDGTGGNGGAQNSNATDYYPSADGWKWNGQEWTQCTGSSGAGSSSDGAAGPTAPS
eukprot:8358969-Lingulodinium_polyedra.AAC.1